MVQDATAVTLELGTGKQAEEAQEGTAEQRSAGCNWAPHRGLAGPELSSKAGDGNQGAAKTVWG